MRRALFEDTGGTLITVPDVKVFSPPIGYLTVYICASLPSLSYFVMLIWLWVVGTPTLTSDKAKNSPSVHTTNVKFQTSPANISVFVRDDSTHSYLSSPRSYLILCDLFYASGDTLFSCYPASEVFLQRMMILYVASHYKNQPNDLQPMSDASTYHLFVLLPPIKDVVWREGSGI